jgi:hypothetical protein
LLVEDRTMENVQKHNYLLYLISLLRELPSNGCLATRVWVTLLLESKNQFKSQKYIDEALSHGALRPKRRRFVRSGIRNMHLRSVLRILYDYAWQWRECSKHVFNIELFFFICIVGGGIKVHSTLRPLNGLLCQPRVIMIMEKSVE